MKKHIFYAVFSQENIFLFHQIYITIIVLFIDYKNKNTY